MSEYTPTVEEVLASVVYLNKRYAEQHGDVDLRVVGSETAAQFRRMIAEVESEAAARALEEAAEQFRVNTWLELLKPARGMPGLSQNASAVIDWLRARAVELRGRGEG